VDVEGGQQHPASLAGAVTARSQAFAFMALALVLAGVFAVLTTIIARWPGLLTLP
jgi:hypothetical protein